MAESEKTLIGKKGLLVTVSQTGVQAFLTLVSADLSDIVITRDSLEKTLAEAGIVFGVCDEALDQLVNTPVYDTKLPVAEGRSPTAGDAASIKFLFDTSKRGTPTIDERGRIDYKELNYIQNARKGQVLARKTPATKGTPGHSVFDEPVPAPPGKDVQLKRGANTVLSGDGLTLTAGTDGAIVLKQKTITVQESQQISGSVDVATGNIECLGSLKVFKNITSDYTVQAAGDIEIGGFVEDANIAAGGSVLARGGFAGGGRGSITAGGSITLKYVDNQKIRAGRAVHCAGDLMNADVYAGEEVVLHGSAGRIVGGRVGAKYLVRAAVIGNEAGVPTHIHVGYDMEAMEKFKEIDDEIERLQDNQAKVKQALVVLYKLEMDGKLPPDKREALAQLKQFTRTIPVQLEKLTVEKEQLRQHLKELSGARVVVEKATFAGSVIHFGHVYKEIQESVESGVVYENANGTIVRTRLDEAKERLLAEERKKALEEQLEANPEAAPVTA